MPAHRADAPEEPQKVVVRDKRRVDPETGEARATDPTAAAGLGPRVAEEAGVGAPAGKANTAAVDSPESPSESQRLLEERTADLQRVKAEYDNYRKRVERDRATVGDLATGNVLGQLVPLLDDIDRAAEHGELSGGFKSVAETLQSTLQRLGLERFCEAGDAFDPAVHEAVMHRESDEVAGPICSEVMRPGYRFRDRLLRPAMVAVAEPPTPDNVGEPEAATVGAAEESARH
ncbi:MAG: nucleotide exchange factor GrpE [Mycobacteriales bacterium]|nr:nucleotide exchange factor GrpE [Frankia sp.]